MCAVQLPGRENRLREPAYTTFPRLIDATFKALLPYLDAPFALFGHSMGALVAFELTRRLDAEGAPAPLHLFVSGHRAPHMPRRRPSLAHLTDEAFIAEIRARYDGVPTEILRHADLMALLLPCLRADMALIESFEWCEAPALTCPISAYGGSDDPEASEAEIAAWRAHTLNRFTVQLFSGGHFFIRTAQRELFAAVSRELEATAQSGSVEPGARDSDGQP